MRALVELIALTLMSAEAEPEPVEPPPPPELMNAAWGVSAEIFGSGPLYEVRAEDTGMEVELAVRTAGGWQRVPVGVATGTNSFYSVEELRFVRGGRGVVVEVERYHDPCACDDGPVWVDVYRSTCRLVQGGRLRCGAARLVSHYDTAP